MKKTTALFLALSLLLLVSGAFAANPIAVGITAIDYQTGAVIGPKNYSVNELFTVRVTVSIPRFTDTSNLTVKLRTDGLTMFEPQIDLRSGEYYLSGVITRQPASLTVEIRDHSFDNANTAEELYNAIQFDRSTAATYKFSAGQYHHDHYYHRQAASQDGRPFRPRLEHTFACLRCAGIQEQEA